MLLRNESKVRHYVEINLTFDDSQKRELIIHEGDRVNISFRRNGRVYNGTGQINEIKIKQYVKNNNFGRAETAILVIDMSGNCSAMIEYIDIKDIVDISIVLDTSSKYPGVDDDIDPGFTITEDEETVKVPDTTEGVVGND